jgi:hypothetical protein
MSSTAFQPPARATHGVAFWIAVVGGLAVAGFGVAGYLERYPDVTRRVELARWIVGVDLAHDFLLAPLVVLAGYLVRRIVPRLALAPVQFGLMASGIVLLIAWRPLQGSAEYKHNATIQPLAYGPATLTVLAIVWTIAVAWFILRVARRPEPTTPRSQPLTETLGGDR